MQCKEALRVTGGGGGMIAILALCALLLFAGGLSARNDGPGFREGMPSYLSGISSLKPL